MKRQGEVRDFSHKSALNPLAQTFRVNLPTPNAQVVLEKKDDGADGKARGKEDESSAPEEKASVVIVKKKKKKRQVDKKVEKVEEENKLTSLLGDYGSDSE